MSYPSPGNELSSHPLLCNSHILRVGALRRISDELALDSGAHYLAARESSTDPSHYGQTRAATQERIGRERQEWSSELAAVADYLEAQESRT